MTRWALLAALALAVPAAAEDAPVTPAAIVEAAPASDWASIDPADLLVMDLAPDRDGNPRRVVIQLIPAPFSQGWVGNIRKLAAAHWWDGTSVNRVQDNYVVQWGDVTEKKALPDELTVVPESEYVAQRSGFSSNRMKAYGHAIATFWPWHKPSPVRDAYSAFQGFLDGWPLANDAERLWPVHCYGMVGVGRNVSPDTGTGAELYTVIGHAPRQLDRNIALVGRIIEGMENLSSLPRGKGELGFYADKEADKRVPILSVRLGSEVASLPRFEYLSTDSQSFASYVHSRANRKDDFYIQPAGGVDVCNVPVPVRRVRP